MAVLMGRSAANVLASMRIGGKAESPRSTLVGQVYRRHWLHADPWPLPDFGWKTFQKAWQGEGAFQYQRAVEYTQSSYDPSEAEQFVGLHAVVHTGFDQTFRKVMVYLGLNPFFIIRLELMAPRHQ